MSPLWSTADFLTATGARLIGTAPVEIGGISIDTRTLERGDAFFAIRGDRFDGHAFVAAAFAAGASLAVVADDRAAELDPGLGPLAAVPEVLSALRALAIAARLRSAARIAAVTGSVGKTSTKEMLAAALAPDGAVHYSPASFNNHWGVPLALARMPVTARYGVFEIGMNHAGEIAPLAKLVRPHVAIITTVQPVHLEFFASVEDIARAKAEIFLGVEPSGAALINRDNPHYALLADLARDAGVGRVVSFGADKSADVRLLRAAAFNGGSTVAARVLGTDIAYKLAAPGLHMVENSLAVLGAVALLGGDLAAAGLALAAFASAKGRGARATLAVGPGSATLIDESYNANPASMRAAIALLRDAAPSGRGRRIAVLGDMRELGETAPELHSALREPLETAGVDRVFLAGPLMGSLWDALPTHLKGSYGESAAEIEEALVAAIAPGDVVMVKGSNASRMGGLVEALKRRLAPPAADQTAAAREEDAA
jgi:UDP-N-acetylmuramoyl-tripeptide--D-alanyl-D-alanine ligase